MEIAGIDNTYACAYCACASCPHGKITPGSDNTCTYGCQSCDSAHTMISKEKCAKTATMKSASDLH